MVEELHRTAAGRLVLVGGNHDVGAMFRGETTPAASSVAAFHGNVASRAALCAGRDCAYAHYVFPDPLAYSAAEMPDPQRWRSYYLRHYVGGRADASVRYPLERLASDPGLQMRTDSHYSPIGHARLAADIAAEMTGIDPEPIFAQAMGRATEIEVRGDLGAKLVPPQTERVLSPPRMDDLRHETNGLVGGNDGMIDLIESPRAATGRTLLVFGDSFFRAKMYELARYWRRIVILRTRFFYPRILDAVAPNDVVTGMAERYLRAVQPDARAPEFFAVPLAAGRSLTPSKGFAGLFREMVDQRGLAGAPSGAAGAGPAHSDPATRNMIEEKMALILWRRREGHLVEPGDSQTDAWRNARQAYRSEARLVIRMMRKRGMKVEIALSEPFGT